jgi:hypothetical protein
MASGVDKRAARLVHSVAAAHPISGGTAPTTAPIHVLISLLVLLNVYGKVYKAKLPIPRATVRGVVPAARIAAEAPALPSPQAMAKGREARREGRGRRKVRFMCRSFSVSMSWLKVLAEQAASMVPTDTAVNGTQATGPPAARKPADVVRTTRALWCGRKRRGDGGIK